MNESKLPSIQTVWIHRGKLQCHCRTPAQSNRLSLCIDQTAQQLPTAKLPEPLTHSEKFKSLQQPPPALVLTSVLVIAPSDEHAWAHLFVQNMKHNKDSNASVYQAAKRKENKFCSSNPLNSVRFELSSSSVCFWIRRLIQWSLWYRLWFAPPVHSVDQLTVIARFYLRLSSRTFRRFSPTDTALHPL